LIITPLNNRIAPLWGVRYTLENTGIGFKFESSLFFVLLFTELYNVLAVLIFFLMDSAVNPSATEVVFHPPCLFNAVIFAPESTRNVT